MLRSTYIALGSTMNSPIGMGEKFSVGHTQILVKVVYIDTIYTSLWVSFV